MAKGKKSGTIKVYLPSGGSIEAPAKATEEQLRSAVVEIDPAVEGSEFVKNDDGSVSFVHSMGTKG